MESSHFLKAAILTFFLVVVFATSWEIYWRQRGFTATYNDDKILWATKRKEVYKPTDEATVFIGPSRIKFDLDIPTWERLTGEEAVQLAIVGTSCRLILNDLAADQKFKGKLIIDATEFTLFSGAAQRDRSATQTLNYYYKETPSQKASAEINYALESKVVFLEEGKFGLNAMLYGLHVPDRKGVISPPAFPKELSASHFDRQTSLTPMFLSSEHLQQVQINNWVQRNNWIKKSLTDKTIHGLKGDSLNAVMGQMKQSIDKIRARGGLVIFVRPPSSGGYKKAEEIVYPRQEYWDKLLAYTHTPGIYYSDYPAIANFVCPEWSHLAPKDGITYTENLVTILKEEKGWKFKK